MPCLPSNGFISAMPQQVQQVSKSVPQPVPQPVAAPAKVDPPQPSHLKVVPIKEDAELLAAESAAKDKVSIQEK